MAIWHVVLISFRPGTPSESKERIHRLYQSLAQECGGPDAGILFFKTDWNLDLRKNIELVQVSMFRDNEALQAFRVHPAHAAIADALRNIADWKVGDIRI